MRLTGDAGPTAQGDERVRRAERLVYEHYGLIPHDRELEVDTGNGRVAVRITEFAPSAPGVPVVALHGIGSTTVLAASLFAGLPARRIIAVDWPGHGLSGPCLLPTALPLRTHVNATLTSLLDELGVTQVDLVGHSMGAQFSLYAALDVPSRVRRVVTLGAPGAAFVGVRPVPAMKALAVPGLGRALLSIRMSERTFRRTQDQILGPGAFDESPPGLVDALHLLAQRRANAASIASYFRALIRAGRVRGDVQLTPDALDRVAQPVLFVWGDQDVFLRPIAAATSIVSVRDVRLLRLPTAGHAPWLQAPTVVSDAVAQHVSG